MCSSDLANPNAPETYLDDVVNPIKPAEPVAEPVSSKSTNVEWKPSPSQVVEYQVQVNGKVACESTTTTCNVKALIGPKTNVQVLAIGNDNTISEAAKPVYVATKPIPALVVNFATASSALTPKAIKDLKAIAKVIKTEGFTKLVVEGHTDNQGGSGLNIDRKSTRLNSSH